MEAARPSDLLHTHPRRYAQVPSVFECWFLLSLDNVWPRVILIANNVVKYFRDNSPVCTCAYRSTKLREFITFLAELRSGVIEGGIHVVLGRTQVCSVITVHTLYSTVFYVLYLYCTRPFTLIVYHTQVLYIFLHLLYSFIFYFTLQVWAARKHNFIFQIWDPSFLFQWY